MFATQQLFTMLTAGILVLTLALVIPGQVTKITPTIEENEVEEEAINLANALMSHPSLAYFDGENYYRGVFDIEKLKLIQYRASSLELIYPDTFTQVTIEDTSGGSWIFSIKDVKSPVIQNYLTCIAPGQVEDLKKCAPTRFSTIMDNGFPVAIRYSENEVHMGTLKVLVVE